ncbi:MAG: hypothetical protein DRQ55_11145 [Planctomycetota bacterium]|nr:MAG: hypothetical protein DRQ55_11145 [Planctomycetota bacterium]
MKQIPKLSLTLQAVDQLRAGIVKGELPPGSVVSEVELAAQLGVSRTPIREALRQLAAEGLVECSTGKAATVTPLSADEVREIYPMIGALERVILASAKPADEPQLARLRQIDQELRGAVGQAEQAIKLDSRWHDQLLLRGGNRRAAELLATLKRQARRYEWIYMYAGEDESASDHEAIVVKLGDGDLAGAGRLLEQHWTTSVHALLGHMLKTENAS